MEIKIYKSDWRSVNRQPNYSCFSTIEGKDQAFGVLQVLNDESLSGNSSIIHTVTTDTMVLLLPVVGGIDFQTQSQTGFVHIGQLQALHLKKGQQLTLLNPYESQLVRYFQLQLIASFETVNFLSEFDLSQRNELLSIFNHELAAVYLGIYDGRQEGTFQLQQANNGVFVMVLQGAFEFQNRLLEAGDALHLLDNINLEYEALSQEAVLLILCLKT